MSNQVCFDGASQSTVGPQCGFSKASMFDGRERESFEQLPTSADRRSFGVAIFQMCATQSIREGWEDTGMIRNGN
jgi:hypothetical protein